MTPSKTKSCSKFLALLAAATGTILPAQPARAAVPGITGPTFDLVASEDYVSQPDGASIYSWGYGCDGSPTGFAPTSIPGNCPAMQLPGPTLIVTEGRHGHASTSERPAGGGGQHVHRVPGVPGGQQRRRRRPAHPGGRERGLGDLHLHRDQARDPRLLQRHPGRPPGRDGALRRHRRPAEHPAGELHVQEHLLALGVRLRPPGQLLRPGVHLPAQRDGLADPRPGAGPGPGLQASSAPAGPALPRSRSRPSPTTRTTSC